LPTTREKGRRTTKKKEKTSAPTDNQMDDIFANPFCSSAPTFAPRVLGKKKEKTWLLQKLAFGNKTWERRNLLSASKPFLRPENLATAKLAFANKTWKRRNLLSASKPFLRPENLATAKLAFANKTRKWQKLAFGNKLFLRPEKLGHCKNWLSPTKLGSGKIRFRQQNFFCSQKNLATAKLAFSNKTWPLQNSLLATQNKSLATKTCPLQKRDRGKTSLDETGSLGLKTQTFNAPNAVRDVPV